MHGYHLLAPNGEAIEQVLILILLTTNNSCFFCLLEPVNWIKIFTVIKEKPKLAIIWCYDVVDKGITAKVEEERTKTITLKYTASNGNKRGVEVRSNH